MDLKNPTRTESLLANIAGYTGVPVPDMNNATRSERLLKEILDNGGGGGGASKEYVDEKIAEVRGEIPDVDDELSDVSENPVQNKVVKSALDGKVNTAQGKSLSTNDYTDADKALVQDSPITVTATTSPVTTAQGKPRKITIFGKSEVVDNDISSAGEGWTAVDLGTLTWRYDSQYTRFISSDISTAVEKPETDYNIANIICPIYVTTFARNITTTQIDMAIAISDAGTISIRNTNYTAEAAFTTAMSGVMLAYKLADPTQDDTVTVKTDNGTGLNGTMAVLETGTPLRGITGGARDVAEWDGSTGEVTKNCDDVDLGTLTWSRNTDNEPYFYSVGISNKIKRVSNDQIAKVLIDKYTPVTRHALVNGTANNVIAINNGGTIQIRDNAYTDVTDFTTAMSGVKLVYELATPITEQFTTAENTNFAALETYSPQTHFTNNANTDMTVEAYANTANGQAVNELKQDVQSEISALKITQSGVLSLTVNGWSNNSQTVTFAHDTSKRNVIDVDPASVEEWASCGVMAISETATGITFKCSAVPENALSFKVTSMGVN